MGEVGTPVGELLQDFPRDQVTRQLQVPQVRGEPSLDELEQHVHVGDHQTCGECSKYSIVSRVKVDIIKSNL